eukprot:5459608-Pyramimonas_sp.AAC.1
MGPRTGHRGRGPPQGHRGPARKRPLMQILCSFCAPRPLPPASGIQGGTPIGRIGGWVKHNPILPRAPIDVPREAAGDMIFGVPVLPCILVAAYSGAEF